MTQLTIRNLPPALEQRLRSQAAQTGTSLNKTVVSLLEEATGLEPVVRPKRDLSDLAGHWTEEEAAEFERAVEPFEHIDEELWK